MLFVNQMGKNGELGIDLGNNAGTYGTTTLTDSETQTFLDSDGGDQLNIHLHVITRHTHLNTLGQSDYAGNVGVTGSIPFPIRRQLSFAE